MLPSLHALPAVAAAHAAVAAQLPPLKSLAIPAINPPEEGVFKAEAVDSTRRAMEPASGARKRAEEAWNVVHDGGSATTQTQSPSSAGEATSTGCKRSRRKEQCRVNQANYRKRKRNYEQQLFGYIQSLEADIQELTTRKHSLGASPDGGLDAEHEIASLFAAMQEKNQHSETPVQRHPHSLAEQFASLVALQFQEFSSIAELRQSWFAYKRYFHTLAIQPLVTERMFVGEYVIIKMEGQVEIWLASSGGDGVNERDAWWTKPFVCPVQHRFELDEHSRVVVRVTSEVSLAAGLASAFKNSSCSLSQILDELMQAKRARLQVN